MAIKYSKSMAGRVDGGPEPSATKLIQDFTRYVVGTASPMTDSSGGTAHALRVVSDISSTFTNVAASGSNLADKTTTEAAFGTVKDALLELATKAGALATLGAVDGITYSGGGTAADGTIGAITVSVTGAATGVQAAPLKTTVDALLVAQDSVVALVNRLCDATGYDKLEASELHFAATVPAITVSGGTAASPGVTKAAVDAVLAAFRANVATIAARINAMTADYPLQYVVVH